MEALIASAGVADGVAAGENVQHIAPHAAARPICPRCGYDQTGVVRSWQDADPPVCPLAGVCSECGLEFEWRDVLDPGRKVPAWSFEHASRSRTTRFVATLALVFLPGALWSRLRLHQPVHVPRLATLTLAPLLVWHVILGAVHVVSHFAGWRVAWWGKASGLPVPEVLWPYMSWLHLPGMVSVPVPPFVLWWLVPAILLGVSMVMLRWTLKRARVRWVHLARATLYALAAATISGVVCSLAFMGVWWASEAGHLPTAAPWSWWLVNHWYFFLACAHMVWLGWWWTRMLVRYLRLRHARTTGMLLSVTAALAWFVAYMTAHPVESTDLLFP